MRVQETEILDALVSGRIIRIGSIYGQVQSISRHEWYEDLPGRLPKLVVEIRKAVPRHRCQLSNRRMTLIVQLEEDACRTSTTKSSGS
jgi:hypothetical protein